MDFEKLLEEKYNFSIKPQQREAVLRAEGPAMLTGVPGSGKTASVALRCANLVLGCGVSPMNILTLTYDKLAREDIEACFRAIFPSDFPRGLLFCTPVEFCGLVMKEYASLVKAAPLRIIENGKRRLLRGMYAEHNGGEYLPDNHLDALVHSISLVKHGMTAGEQAQESCYGTVNNFKDILAAYNAYMAANNCVDYDEMQVRALAAFGEEPALLERFRMRFSYINVDEAQELSALQFEIIKKLAAPANNLFMTGDADQCLYSSRAACPECLDEFIHIYPDAAVYKMERNYRSTHAIADAAGRLIKQNFVRQMVTMNTGNEIGMPVEETLLDGSGLLAGHIVARLKDLAEPGEAVVIYRRNCTAAVIADALDREGIPFRIRGQKLAFFDHWVVQDILAFLALGHDPADIVSLKRIYRKCNAYVGKDVFTQAESLVGQGGGADALDALITSPTVSGNASAQLKKLKENIASLPGMPPGNAIRFVLDKLEYGDYLKKACGEGLYLGSLMHIAESMAEIASCTEDYPQFLKRVAQLSEIFQSAGKCGGAAAVTLTSAHAAKGAEFSHVYLVDLQEGSFPALAAVAANNDGKRALMEEERRLLYMAATRAGKFLELIYLRKMGGNRLEPSRFIRELLPRSVPRKARPAGSARKPHANTLPHKKQAGRKSEAPRPAQSSPAFEQFALENGMSVNHMAFGEGVISAYDDKRDIVTIRFDKFGVKKLAAVYSMNNGVIRKTEDQGGDSASSV